MFVEIIGVGCFLFLFAGALWAANYLVSMICNNSDKTPLI